MAPKRKLPTTANYRKGSREWRKQVKAHDPDYFHKANIRCLYKLTWEQWREMYERQNGVCALCHKPNQSGKRLCVDHDHTTGLIRGLLCTRCNSALGKFEITWFVRVVFYLTGKQVPRLPDEQPTKEVSNGQ